MEIPQIQQQLQINRVLLAINHDILPSLIERRNYLRAQGNDICAERKHKVVVATRKVIARYAALQVALQVALKKDMKRALFQEKIARIVNKGKTATMAGSVEVI